MSTEIPYCWCVTTQFWIKSHLLLFFLRHHFRAKTSGALQNVWCLVRLHSGLSLRDGGRGFPPAIINMAPSYFQRKIKQKSNQKKPLAVWFPTHLLYLPCNLKNLVTTLLHFPSTFTQSTQIKTSIFTLSFMVLSAGTTPW